jgi:uncharacterized LabA/DUF88 family protein
MASEPQVKRVIAFIDGQNLFHAAKENFGYEFPSYDVGALARAVCARETGWQLVQVRFYTGIHEASENAKWNSYWARKLLGMSRQGVVTFTRPLRYREKTVTFAGGGSCVYRAAEEKGIDVRIAIDVIRLGHHGNYDVCLIFSQDQDLSEAAKEIRAISKEQDRWIHVASAFPDERGTRSNHRGINGTDWKPIDRATYDSCLDPRDTRP